MSAVDLDALIERLQKLGRDMDRHAHPDWDEHEDVFAAVNAITALRRDPVSAGKVKALVWDATVTTYYDREAGRELPAAEFWQADTILMRGRYTIMRLVDARVKGDHESYRLDRGGAEQKFHTLKAAKAAAQADYEARIIAALQPGDEWQAIDSMDFEPGTWGTLWPGTHGPFTACWDGNRWTMCDEHEAADAQWVKVLDLQAIPAPPAAPPKEGG